MGVGVGVCVWGGGGGGITNKANNVAKQQNPKQCS